MREEPGPRGTPPPHTARTERSRRRGWPGRPTPLPCSQAARGGGTQTAAAGVPGPSGDTARAPAPRRAGWRPERARQGARKGRHGAEGSVGRGVEAEGLPEGRAAEGCWGGKEGSPRTLPFLEPSLLPVGGSPGSAAPAKAGNRAMSQLTATTICPKCPAERRGKMAPRRRACWEM